MNPEPVVLINAFAVPERRDPESGPAAHRAMD